jgi:outer membrane protein
LPVISFNHTRGDESQDILSRENDFFGLGKSDFTTNTFAFQVTQPIFRMASFVRLGQSKALVRQAHALYIAAEQDLILRTAEAYLTVLAARDNLRFARVEQAAIARQLTLVQGRRRGGLANITDEYEAQARSARVQADVIAANYALDDAYQALREIVGDAVSDVYSLKQEIPLIPPDPAQVDTWIDRAIESNLSLIGRNEAASVAEREVQRRRAAHYPTLDLVARRGNTDTGGAVTGGASDVDSSSVLLQLNVPLYSGGIVRSQTREANKIYRRTLEERKLQHLVVMRETRAAFQGVQSAISLVKALGDSLRSQESALAGRTKGYRSGVNTFLDVLDAERDLTSTRRDYARARYAYLLNLLRLRQQVGSLGESDLLYINGMLETTNEAK